MDILLKSYERALYTEKLKYKEHKTLKEIGVIMGVSHQRVSQILSVPSWKKLEHHKNYSTIKEQREKILQQNREKVLLALEKKCKLLKSAKLPIDSKRLLAKINRIEKKKSISISNTRVYNIWSCMKQRCLNPNNKNFSIYGGRGITVSEEWQDSFIAFLRDTLSGYKSNLTIDRVNNNKGYQKGNVRWIPQNEQQKNRRPSSEWVYKGK